MTLDKAIKDLETEYKSDFNLQLAEWLKELKKFREQQSEDAISREDALKALAYDIESFEFKSGVSRHMNEIANLLNTIYEIQSDNIKALPSVQPKPKVGHWIYELEDWNKWACSECGWSKRTDVHVKLGYSYCPNCGARMIEPQEVMNKESHTEYNLTCR